ncbi:AbrB/MazE/SpoVT family DNA-binding domain-containing protein [Paenibacillus sp. NPDC055715]
MKSTGMTRPLDTLGRIVIPKEMRISMGIDIGDPLEFFKDVESGLMGIRKYYGSSCKLCNSGESLTYFRNSLLCRQCILDMKGNIGVIPVIKKPAYIEKRVNRSLQQLKKLRSLIREHPHAKQSEYANWLGVTASRISQLKKLL